MSVHLDPRAIVGALGGEVSGNSCNVPGPGHSKNDRSLSITIDPRAPDGFVVHSFTGQDPLACKDYIRERLGLGEWKPGQRRNEAPVTPRDSSPDPKKEESKRWALKIWSQSSNPKGTVVQRYLREHRGLDLSDSIAGGVVRFHAGLKFDDAYVPGMVCLLRNIITNEPCGIHRTFLDRKTAEKIDRKMLGVAKGAAIKLDNPIGNKLTIGEGVETALSAMAMGLCPVWAMGSSVAIEHFPMLKGLTEITILEEDDIASRRAVEACGRRYFYSGIPARVITPSVGKDMNDAWRAAL